MTATLRAARSANISCTRLEAVAGSMPLKRYVASVLPAKLAQPMHERARVRVLGIGSLQLGRGSPAEHVRHYRELRCLRACTGRGREQRARGQ